ncbi:cysteine hydrolase family protein [Pseudonocardia phyllosphaerae]|uniref:cysteine hydrolase family protein n=1 Tax=Pseudonocardia phyllosphaerae TaxID=3390502 RepID=UPI003978FD27
MSTALVVLDAQESFRARPDDWATIAPAEITDRISTLVEHARSAGDEIVWVLHTEPGTGTVFDPGIGHVRLLPGLIPDAGEIELSKTSHNAFTSTDLDQQLRERGVDHVVICGIRTEQCCETTARVASDLGYRVTFVLDATATMPLPRWRDSGDLAPEDIRDRTAAALQGRFADVVTLDDVVAS